MGDASAQRLALEPLRWPLGRWLPNIEAMAVAGGSAFAHHRRRPIAKLSLAAVLFVATLATTMSPPGQTKADAAGTYFDAGATEGSLYRLYRAYFIREPDSAGFTYWYFATLKGETMAQISDHFARSNEFDERYGSLTDEAFVDLVYKNVLGRDRDQAGSSYWLRRLDSDMSRGTFMLRFSDAGEYRARTSLRLPPGYRAGTNALAMLSSLPVEPEGSRGGFDPALFAHWSDDDGNGCDTACDRFAIERRSDGTWFSVWDGKLTANRSELRVDHVVSLAEAWDSGASEWTAGDRARFANWTTNLVVTTGVTDDAKGDGDVGDWYPPRAVSNCVMAETVVATKIHWILAIDAAEKAALTKMLTGCTSNTSDAPPVPKPQPQQVVTYSVVAKGSISTNLESFADHAALTMNDPRGWSMGGSIEFRRVPSGGNFTLVLAQASQVPSYGPPCHASWSCRSGRNVIVNETRWRNASDSWTLGLDNYQHYVVIHELGHWLGEGHASCPRSGSPAPVMMQQSINRGSCTNNVWPLDSERTRVAARRGASIRP